MREHSEEWLVDARKRLLEMRAAGQKNKEIQKALGVSQYLFYELSKDTPLKRGRYRYSRTERVALRKQAQDLREQGVLMVDIAKRMDVSLTLVADLLTGSENPRCPSENLGHLRPRATELRASGASTLEVSVILNIHTSTAQRWAREERQKSLQPAA